MAEVPLEAVPQLNFSSNLFFSTLWLLVLLREFSNGSPAQIYVSLFLEEPDLVLMYIFSADNLWH